MSSEVEEGTTTTPTIEPYHPPTLPSSIQHVALSSKSFRVFGLKDPAWKNARKEWRRYKSRLGAAGGGKPQGEGENNNVTNNNGSILKSALKTGKKGNLAIPDDDDDDDYSTSEDERHAGEADAGEVTKEEEEQEEITLICEAIQTALKEDAGGYGTAGFHVSKVDHVQHLSKLNNGTSAAAYDAEIVPHDAELNEPIDPASILTMDDETGRPKFFGNDEFYLTGGGEQSTYHGMQLRITVSKAREGLAAKRYYDALFAKRRELTKILEQETSEEEANGIVDMDVDIWVEEDQELRELQDRLLEAIEGGRDEGEEDAPLGYYVEMMLVEPHVRPEEIVIAPPTDIDKLNPISRPAIIKHPKSRSQEVDEHSSLLEQQNDDDGEPQSRSIFHRDIYASRQFAPSGPWEKANTKAFADMGLDVRKALVRVEFPVFPEGCKDKTFRETYQLNARLKSGSFATVCRGTHRATGKKIAVKCVLRKDLPPSDDAAIYDEVLILSTLRHSYICPLIDFFEERECYFLVMELMSGGDLFDRIGKRKNYTENDARDLCRKMLESVRYCHENSVAHCDMKPKNLLLVSDEDDVQIKLADFGFATRVYEPQSLTKQCGTPFFVAPEVLMRSPYDQQSDLWSCGVIMFLLLGGDLPFVGRNQKELFRNIVMGKYEFEEQSWSHVSDEAKNLVKGLLVTDPSKRLSCREAMASPWMRQRGNMLAMNNLQYTSQRLKGFNARMKLRASMICVSSVVSLRMSLKGLSNKSMGSVGSERAMSGKTSKRPSFLDLPDEENLGEDSGDEEDVEEKSEGKDA